MPRKANDRKESRRRGVPPPPHPLKHREAVERFSVPATERVPAKLRDVILPDVPPYELRGIDRKEATRGPPEGLEPSRPAWVASSAMPRRAPAPVQPRKIMHRGRPLEPGVVFPPDDRRTYNDRSYPWGAVCKVVTAAGYGSGVIVGPRHVLTASHVVDWSRNGAGTVEVHRAGGSVAATTAITRVWYYTKVTGLVDWFENDEDYAVLVTSQRIGDAFGWLGTRTYDSGWDGERYWYSIGYPSDVAGGNTPVWQRYKWLNEDAWDWGGGRSMETDADMIPGQSGSPMFAWWSDGPYVVAVWSNYSSDENWCSGGSDMTYLVRYARNKDA